MIRHPKLTKDTEYEIERVVLNNKFTQVDGQTNAHYIINMSDSILNYDYIIIRCSSNYVDVRTFIFDPRSITYNPYITGDNQNSDLSDMLLFQYITETADNFQIDPRYVHGAFRDDRTLCIWGYISNSYLNSIDGAYIDTIGYRLKKKH